MISFDTETTGVDFFHGARPFCAVAGREDGSVLCWEWDVEPVSRQVLIPEEDVREIREVLTSAISIVGQNIKFDAKALDHADVVKCWNWSRTHDTLIAGHLLGSNQPHDLTSMTLQYLGVNILPFETRLEEAVQEARRWCRSYLPEWGIAKKDRQDMPSAKEKTWKYDTWLPRALRNYENHGPAEWDA